MKEIDKRENEDEEESKGGSRRRTSGERLAREIFNINDSSEESYEITPKARFKRNKHIIQKKRKKAWQFWLRKLLPNK